MNFSLIFGRKGLKFLKLTSSEKESLDSFFARIRPTNGWDNPCFNEPALSDFHCSATLSGCDFEGVTCAVTAANMDGTLFCSFSVYCKLRKMPKRYRDDRRAGITKPFAQYKQGIRERNEIKLELRMYPASMNRALHGVWKASDERERRKFLNKVKSACATCLRTFRLGPWQEIMLIDEAMEFRPLYTGWREEEDGANRFVGIGQHTRCRGYLGEPSDLERIVEMDDDPRFQGFLAFAMNLFCDMCKGHPSLLLIAAYGILQVLYSPPPVPAEARLPDGGIPISLRISEPTALVVVGPPAAAGTAVRIFADTNYDGKVAKRNSTWLDEITQEGHFLLPVVQKGAFQSMSCFAYIDAKALEPSMAKRWQELRQYGLYPVVWAPNLVRTHCSREELRGIVRVPVEKSAAQAFQDLSKEKWNAFWKILLRAFLFYLQDLPNREFLENSLRFDSYRDWRKNLDIPGADALRDWPQYGSLVFAMDRFLRWGMEIRVIDETTRREMLERMLGELPGCARFLDERELDRLHRYFDPVFRGENPGGRKGAPPYKFWLGRDRNTKDPFLYVEMNRWLDHYRTVTGSTASATEIHKALKPYLMRRPDQSGLGMPRVYHDPQTGKSEKLYVLCIQKNKFCTGK